MHKAPPEIPLNIWQPGESNILEYLRRFFLTLSEVPCLERARHLQGQNLHPGCLFMTSWVTHLPEHSQAFAILYKPLLPFASILRYTSQKEKQKERLVNLLKEMNSLRVYIFVFERPQSHRKPWEVYKATEEQRKPQKAQDQSKHLTEPPTCQRCMSAL